MGRSKNHLLYFFYIIVFLSIAPFFPKPAYAGGMPISQKEETANIQSFSPEKQTNSITTLINTALRYITDHFQQPIAYMFLVEKNTKKQEKRMLPIKALRDEAMKILIPKKISTTTTPTPTVKPLEGKTANKKQVIQPQTIQQPATIQTIANKTIPNVLDPYPGFAASADAPDNKGKLFTKNDEYLRVKNEDLPPFGRTRTPTALLAVAQWFHVEASRRYKTEVDGTTKCNIFVWDASLALGVEVPRYAFQYEWYMEKYVLQKTNANWLYDWFTGEGAKKNGWKAGKGSDVGWTEVTPKDAQFYANQGYPVIASARFINQPGHIALVIPGRTEEKNGISYPNSAQAGRINFVGKSTWEGFHRGLESNAGSRI